MQLLRWADSIPSAKSWALATVPMGLHSWIVFPALSPDYRSDPLTAGVTRIVLLTMGLIWSFALGSLSGTSRLFEVVDLVWWFMGANVPRICDFMQAQSDIPSTGQTVAYVLLAVALFLYGFTTRLQQMRSSKDQHNKRCLRI